MGGHTDVHVHGRTLADLCECKGAGMGDTVASLLMALQSWVAPVAISN